MAGISLLVVEDDPFFGRKMLRALGLGSEARLVPTLEAARGVLATERPHLVVVDIGLPDGCGFDLVEQAPPIGLPGGGQTPRRDLHRGRLLRDVRARDEGRRLLSRQGA